jgi:hypothetical protein
MLVDLLVSAKHAFFGDTAAGIKHAFLNRR